MELFTEENNEAEALVTSGNLAGAAKKLVDIVELDPANYRAYNTIGIIAWTRHAWKDAFSMFFKSVTIKPDYTDALINLFDASLKLHCVNDIKMYFEQALRLKQSDEELKSIYESMINNGDNIYSSERALRIGLFNPRIDAAEALINENKLAEASRIFIDIHDNEGPSERIFSGLGIIAYNEKRYNDAFILFIEAIRYNPTCEDNFLNMLDTGKLCGRGNDAKKIFRSYLEKYSFLKKLEKDFE
jgi:tetratricopeptide (TPR) repeat protein